MIEILKRLVNCRSRANSIRLEGQDRIIYNTAKSQRVPNAYCLSLENRV